MKQAIATDRIAPAVGPFSAAILSGGILYSSGQIALDRATSRLSGNDVAEQTRQVFRNLAALLEAGGKSLADVVKVNGHLADMGDFAAMNDVYAEHFEQPYPARTTAQAAALPLGALVEIDVVAH